MNFIKRLLIIKVAVVFLLLISTTTTSGQDQHSILFFGDSITAGYGLDEEQAYPALIQEKIDSLGLEVRVINAGLSGETTAGGVRRVEWILQQEIDIFFLGLGGNDGLRGIDPANTKSNLQQIIEKVKQKDENIEIILAGMEAPPNLGDDYTTRFRNVFSELADENNLIFMPFLLDDVAGERELNQPDGIHPTAEGQQIIADHIWEIIKPLLVDVP
ncbi:arylesterase [Rhodohalobacter sp. SW132]|uniref:arylesterase n=1 Tax=Rhodohalobacter sp. SW132 TaxID=2293433 RepID=UPI000E245325|nr:arylesterase [Rhodohalobacter sp. SW132]REL38016.1 arylesterase [Rhodohalobacter sp. SW132]